MSRLRETTKKWWTWLGHASIAHFVWSIGLGTVVTAVLRGLTDLPWPWLLILGTGLAFLVLAALLTWGPLAHGPVNGAGLSGEVTHRVISASEPIEGVDPELHPDPLPLDVRIDAMTMNGIHIGHFRGNEYWIVQLRQIAVNNRSKDPIQFGACQPR